MLVPCFLLPFLIFWSFCCRFSWPCSLSNLPATTGRHLSFLNDSEVCTISGDCILQRRFGPSESLLAVKNALRDEESKLVAEMGENL